MPWVICRLSAGLKTRTLPKTVLERYLMIANDINHYLHTYGPSRDNATQCLSIILSVFITAPTLMDNVLTFVASRIAGTVLKRYS